MPGVAVSENVQVTMRHSARPQPALGKAIRQLREKGGETQEAIARRADIAIPTLSLIEGGNANPTWDTVKGIAAALDVSIGELAKLSEKFED
jgi:transcriptional regulator with XRE-family HTH domain